MADTATVGGQALLLNGMGLREKYTLDIYVGGLYLPSRTTSSSTAIQQDVPKRITMHFIYKEVTAAQMAETFHEGRAKLGDTTALEARFAKLDGWLSDVHKGDVVTLDYVPGKGTTLSYNGTERGTLEGADMMRALWTIYLGPSPASKSLKEGMLGL
ncbi:chalcone isomerase family protein [Myxococcota bacterium]|nr:chalcone isomerase family protein [Myxococcota bacterium]